MLTIKNWVRENPVLAIAAVLIVATIFYSLFFGSADAPA